MDSNYEAQRQFTRQRLTARREQAAAERLLREGQAEQASGLKQFIATLFRRSDHQKERKRARQSPPRRLAIMGKDKG